MDRTYRETETQKTKKSTYLSHAEVFKPGQIDESTMCAKNTRFFVKKKKKDLRNSISFICYFRPNTSAFETQTLYQHQSALPYMGCCTLPCSSTKRTNDTGSHATIRVKKKNVDVLSMMMTCNGRYSQDEVRPANYIKFTYYQLSQLKLNNATRERIMQLLR